MALLEFERSIVGESASDFHQAGYRAVHDTVLRGCERAPILSAEIVSRSAPAILVAGYGKIENARAAIPAIVGNRSSGAGISGRG